MTIMITGGTGFLGSYLARHLVEEKGESHVVLFDMYPTMSRIESIKDNVTVVHGDILEQSEILVTMNRFNVDRVVHLAAILGDALPEKIVPYLRVQSIGSANVFEACRLHGVERIAYASSAAVYLGNPTPFDEVDEDDPPMPANLYGASKLWGEHVLEVYREKHGLDYVALRPTSVFGLGRGQRGSWPITMPKGDTPTDWMYGADAAEAWYLALTVKDPAHRVFNVRSERRTVGDVTRFLRRILPDARIDEETDPMAAPLQLMSNKRLVEDLGFKAKWTMETGMVDYLSRIRVEAGLAPIEIAPD